jgi:hypothetical protein
MTLTRQIIKSTIIDANPLAVPAYDRDAKAYFARVLNLGGHFASSGYTSSTTRAAINQWFIATRDFGVYSKITEAYLLAGPTFPGILAKLKRSSVDNLTNGNFVSGDYIQSGPGAGLKGNASNKFLVPSINSTSISNSLSAYLTVAATGSTSRLYVGGQSGSMLQILGQINNGVQEAYGCGNNFTNYAGATVTRRNGYLVGTSRANNDRQMFRNGVSTGTNTNTVSFTPGFALDLFRNSNNSSYTDARITFAHIGDGLTDTEAANLSTTTNALMTVLGANVY